MSKQALQARWDQLRSQHRVALIPYLTSGYPTRAACRDALSMVAQAGANVVEIGIPFSDPLADGPVIQQSSEVALSHGMTVAGTIELVREAALDIPVIVFGYLNPILGYGLERFLDDTAAAGVSGLLLTDLPAGEDPNIERAVRESQLALIRLVAVTTDDARLPGVVAGAEGFVYLISRLGVTGPETTLDSTVEVFVARVRQATALPLAVGFGIATADQAARAAKFADGVVVGSALVRRLEQGLHPARELLEEMRSAVDEVGAGLSQG